MDSPHLSGYSTWLWSDVGSRSTPWLSPHQSLPPHGGGRWIRSVCAGDGNFGREVAISGTSAKCNSPFLELTDSDMVVRHRRSASSSG